jgi:hypothetical protein
MLGSLEGHNMSRIRNIEIRHFRGIERLDWAPGGGINVIGPGDGNPPSRCVILPGGVETFT